MARKRGGRHYVPDKGKTMPSGRGARSRRSKSAWRRRKRVSRELRVFHRNVAGRRGLDPVADAERTAKLVASTADEKLIRKWREDPRNLDVVDVDTLRALAKVKALARRRVRVSKTRVGEIRRRAKSLKMKIRARRDLTTGMKRRLERKIDATVARAVRTESDQLRRDLVESLAEAKVVIRISIRKRWNRERKRRAEYVAGVLKIDNLLIADLLIARAERVGVAYDAVDWDAVQVSGKKSDYTEFVAQLDQQIGRETVSAGEAKAYTEITPGKFVDVDTEIGRAAEDYENYLRNLVARGQLPEDAVEPRVQHFLQTGAASLDQDPGTVAPPVSFEQGNPARAVRDVLAKEIAEGGGAEEPHAVATAIVQEAAAAGLDTQEVVTEYLEQTVEATAREVGLAVQQDLAGGGQVKFTDERRTGLEDPSRGPGPLQRDRRARRGLPPQEAITEAGRKHAAREEAGERALQFMATPRPPAASDRLPGLDPNAPPVTDDEARALFSKMGSKDLYAIYVAGHHGGRRLDGRAWSDLLMYLFNAWRAEGYGTTRASRKGLHETIAFYEEAGYSVEFYPHHSDSDIARAAEGKRAEPGEFQDYTVLYKPKLLGGPKSDPDKMIAKLGELEEAASQAQAPPQYLEMVRRWRERVESAKKRKEDHPGAYSDNTVDYSLVRYHHGDIFQRLTGSIEGTGGLENERLYGLVVDRELEKWKAAATAREKEYEKKVEKDAAFKKVIADEQRIPFAQRGILTGKFPYGAVVSTPGALAALEESGQNPEDFLRRHISGDWGEVPAEDKRENELSLKAGYRLLSAYRTRKGTKVWVITEADRSATTLLLPEEY